jgi:hypothetical protein
MNSEDKTIFLDENINLFYLLNNKYINISELYQGINIENQDNFRVEYLPDVFQIIVNDSLKIEISRFPLTCNFHGKNKTVTIYSLPHLILALKFLNYTTPIYYSQIKENYIKLDINDYEKLKDIFLENDVIIKEAPTFDEKTKKIFDEQMELIKKYQENQNRRTFIYKMISYNIKQYLQLNNDFDLNKIFIYDHSLGRYKLECEIENFLKNNKTNIYAISGPYGIGKSLTSLFIQKNLYLKNIKSLYINLKYYYKIIPWENKINTLLSECFFLCDKAEDLSEYQKILEYKEYSSIWFYLQDIYKFIIYNKDIQNNTYLFIFDQYKLDYEDKNTNENLFYFNKIKLFLLSSINDKDIKTNLKNILLKKDAKINYLYQKTLLSNNNYIMKEIITSNIKNKKGINNTFKILEQFNYLPRYISLFIDKYENIFDLLFNESSKIFKNINKFFQKENADISIISKLKSENIISKEKENYLKLNQFVYILDLLPLKYINYSQEKNKEKYCFTYAFPLCEKLLDEYNLYINQINIFYKNNIEQDYGKEFENILKISLKYFNLLNIDGYYEVNTIYNLDLSEDYEAIDSDYFNNKKNIFISQKVFNGKLYDFCIYKPVQKTIILLQAKYIINSDNVLDINAYKNDISRFLSIFETKFDIKIQSAYMLYISSYLYNQSRKNEVLKALSNKTINCLFYDINNKEFSFDFENKFNDIPLNNSFLIYPQEEKCHYSYYKQYSQNIFDETENNFNIYYIGKKRFINNQKKDIDFDKIPNNSPIKKLYSEFLNFISQSGLDNELKNNLKEFIFINFLCFENGFIIAPKYNTYYLLFKIKNDLINSDEITIDFSKDLCLIYKNNNNHLIYFNLNKNEIYSENDFKEIFNKNYNVAIGKYGEI